MKFPYPRYDFWAGRYIRNGFFDLEKPYYVYKVAVLPPMIKITEDLISECISVYIREYFLFTEPDGTKSYREIRYDPSNKR